MLPAGKLHEADHVTPVQIFRLLVIILLILAVFKMYVDHRNNTDRFLCGYDTKRTVLTVVIQYYCMNSAINLVMIQFWGNNV